MITKINVPKTSIVIEIENKEIKIENMIGYDMKMVFRNQDAEPSLDENGDVYIEANKQNLFDLCGLRGELS